MMSHQIKERSLNVAAYQKQIRPWGDFEQNMGVQEDVWPSTTLANHLLCTFHIILHRETIRLTMWNKWISKHPFFHMDFNSNSTKRT
jgi:hypothetical protein